MGYSNIEIDENRNRARFIIDEVCVSQIEFTTHQLVRDDIQFYYNGRYTGSMHFREPGKWEVDISVIREQRVKPYP
jgi:hypothetical protein